MSFVHCADAGAPVLNNAAGSLIALLDYVLVTGTGWSKVFSGVDKAVYRAPAGRRFYFRVDDSAGATARIVGYEAMTDVDTGTNPFPTAVQSAGGLYVVKASSALGFPYALAASSRGFMCWNQPGSPMPDAQGNATSFGGGFGFGDLNPALPDDPFAVYIIGSTSTAYASTGIYYSSATGTAPGHYLARAYSGLGAALPFAKYSVATYLTYAYPNPADNGIYLDPVRVNEIGGGGTLRGTVPGWWQLVHTLGVIPHGTRFDGFGTLSGRSFIALQGYSSTYFCLETTVGTWDY